MRLVPPSAPPARLKDARNVTAPDFEADGAETSAGTGDLSNISKLAAERRRLEKEIEKLSEDIFSRSERIRAIDTEALPDLMLSVNMKSFKLEDGTEITVKDVVSGSIPSESSIEKEKDEQKKADMERRRAAAIQWLRKHKAESLIKNEVSVQFGKGEDSLAKKVITALKKMKIQGVRCDQTVNHQTLNAFLRDRISAGVNIPSEPFSLFTGKKAEFKAPKEK